MHTLSLFYFNPFYFLEFLFQVKITSITEYTALVHAYQLDTVRKV